MGCVRSKPSETTKPTETPKPTEAPKPKLSTVCSGAICNFTADDISGADVFGLMPDNMRNRIITHMYLMNFDKLKTARDLFNPDVGLSGNEKFSSYYTKMIQYINQNGKSITDSQINLLITAAPFIHQSGPVSPIALQFGMVSMMMMSPENVPTNVSTWYDKYVNMLYQKVTRTPAYTPAQLNDEVGKWIEDNATPVGSVSGFTNKKVSSNPLQSILGNVKNMQNISGFTNFKPYDGVFERNRFKNDYHSF